MTIKDTLELGAFIGHVVARIIKAATEAWSSDKTVTVEDLNKVTQKAFDSWGQEKSRHWRLVHQMADKREVGNGKDKPE